MLKPLRDYLSLLGPSSGLLDELRQSLLRRTLPGMVMLGLPLAALVLVLEALDGKPGLAVFYGTVAVASITILSLKPVPYKLRAVVLFFVIYAIALSELKYYGAHGLSISYFTAMTLFVLLFFGTREAIGAYFLGLLSEGTAAVLYVAWLPDPVQELSAGGWIAHLFTYTWLTLSVVIGVSLLLRSMEAVQQASDSLVQRLQNEVGERKRAEESLKSSEARYSLLAEHGSEIIWECDDSLTCRFVSPAVEHLLGWSPQELIGRPAASVLALATDEVERHMMELIAVRDSGNTGIPGEISLRGKDGHLYWFEMRSIRHMDESGQFLGISGSFRDITRRKAIEEQLVHAQKMEAIGQLAGGVAHDFNNILQAIRGHTELALDRLGDEVKLDRHLRVIDESAERARVLVAKLLAFSRRDASRPMYLDLNMVVNELHGMLQRMLGERVELVFDPDDEAPAVLADPGQIEQILVNLCVNARDAMPQGGRILIRTARRRADAGFAAANIEVNEGGLYALLQIEDEGEGIPEESRPRVFDPFYTTKPLGEGTGLGLSTVYGVVKGANGLVTFDTEVGRGTRFDILLPGFESQSRSKTEAASEKAFHSQDSELILVAEDEAMVRNLAAESLIAAGYQVIEASDGEEAWALFLERETEIDLCLLDVVMPKLDGHELRARIKERKPRIPVIFASGYSDEQLDADGGLADAPLLKKPYHRTELLSVIHETLHGG
ncbi:MAG: PAS domain S-box protein [Candidatus Hydrogenedens sp.]|nr:PAS domain S-box protein [Candidatus Hydrogenedens sp.]